MATRVPAEESKENGKIGKGNKYNSTSAAPNCHRITAGGSDTTPELRNDKTAVKSPEDSAHTLPDAKASKPAAV